MVNSVLYYINLFGFEVFVELIEVVIKFKVDFLFVFLEKWCIFIMGEVIIVYDVGYEIDLGR